MGTHFQTRKWQFALFNVPLPLCLSLSTQGQELLQILGVGVTKKKKTPVL